MPIYKKLSLYLCIYVCITAIYARQLNIFTLDKGWICDIKRSCVDCLRLSQCSWCSSTNKCFSEKLPFHQNYCNDSKVGHVDYGMSLEDNARCACDPKQLSDEKNCKQPDASVECSGRGSCLCGRCFCNTLPDHENPSKCYHFGGFGGLKCQPK